jgi:hypothetical protein
MIPDLLFNPLLFVAFLWLCLMLHIWWSRDPTVKDQKAPSVDSATVQTLP